MSFTPTKEHGKAGQVVEFVIPAGGEFTIKATGSHVSILEASTRVSFKLDHYGECRGMAGSSFSCSLGSFYENVTFRNPTAQDAKVMAYFGFGVYSEARAEFTPVYSIMRAQTFSAIPAGQSVTLPGVAIGALFQRFAVYITNLDPAAYLTLKDSLGNESLVVFPKQSICLETSGPLTVANTGGVDLACRVAEGWFCNRAATLPPAPANPFA
jgi:hypothetical protein